MPLGVQFELPLSSDSLLNIPWWHFPLLDQSSHSDRTLKLYCGLVKKNPDARRARRDERRRTYAVRGSESIECNEADGSFFNSPLKYATQLVVAVP
jgi:hypothetical protein